MISASFPLGLCICALVYSSSPSCLGLLPLPDHLVRRLLHTALQTNCAVPHTDSTNPDTQTVQTMEHPVHKLTIPSTLHHIHTISYIARYVQASYPVRSYIHWELNLNTRVYIGRPCFSREWHGKIGQGTDKTHLLTQPYLPKEMRHTSTYNGSDFSEAERIFGISDFYCCCSLLMTLTLSLSVS